MKKTILIPVLVLCWALTACNKDTDKNEKIYTENDIFLRSYECGYQGDFPQFTIIIETEEQLDYAEQNYGLESNDFIKEMISQCPIEKFAYVISYDAVTGTGYYLHADRLKINEDGPIFLMDSKSHEPKAKAVPQVENGFMHMAAIPKEYLAEYDLTDKNYIYPGE